MIDERLKEYATARQLEYIDAINLHGSARKAAVALGVHPACINRAIISVKRKAATQGYAPDYRLEHPVPEGFLLERFTTQIGKDGTTERQWVKGAIDKDKLKELMSDLWETFAADIPRAPEVPAPTEVAKHLLNLYTFTDYHMGMLAWHREGGADWDLGIATQMLRSAFTEMMQRCPPAKKAVINIQGDFLHTDGLRAVTPASGHVLDADSRYRKICLAAVTVIREMVTVALERHEEVELLICEGNHDEAGSGWMQICFLMHFGDNPRVKVHDQVLPYYAIKWGQTMLAFHHGHMKKNDQLPLLFASQFGLMWGQTTKRYCNTGHRHHYDCKEHSGMYVTQHPTLSARDAYAARGGWISERAAIGITFHDEWGKWDERWVTAEQVGGYNGSAMGEATD